MTMLWNNRGLATVPLPSTYAETDETEFMAELAEVSRQLSLTRLRCSLFSIKASSLDAHSALWRLKERFERAGVVGMLDDRNIGFLHLDRCTSPERDDAAVAAEVRRLAVGALAPDGMKKFVALHYWTDEVSVVEDLVRQLADRAFRRAEYQTHRAFAAAAAI